MLSIRFELIIVPHLIEHRFALDSRLQFGAQKEAAAHLPVQRVGFLRGRRQSVLQHHRDQVVDAHRRRLGAEVELAVRRERLAQDEHRLQVRFLHHLKVTGPISVLSVKSRNSKQHVKGRCLCRKRATAKSGRAAHCLANCDI